MGSNGKKLVGKRLGGGLDSCLATLYSLSLFLQYSSCCRGIFRILLFRTAHSQSRIHRGVETENSWEGGWREARARQKFILIDIRAVALMEFAFLSFCHFIASIGGQKKITNSLTRQQSSLFGFLICFSAYFLQK